MIQSSNDMDEAVIQRMGVVAAAKEKYAALTSTYDDILLQPPQPRKKSRSEFVMRALSVRFVLTRGQGTRRVASNASVDDDLEYSE